MDKVSGTLFESLFDIKTDKKFVFPTFKEFESILYRLSEKPRKDKKSAELMSPAFYSDGTTRKNDNVEGWGGWCAIDVDDCTEDLEQFLEKKCKDYYYICYSTASSTKDLPKFRLVFPLTEFVTKDKIKHFWFALNKELGEMGDIQTKDLSRMYYIPGKYANAYNFIFTKEAGNAINNKYPITAKEIAYLCRELDLDTGNWYDKRPLDKEAERALEFVHRNSL